MTATINLNEQLKHHFGFDSFKGDQEAIIRNLLEGNDTFVLMLQAEARVCAISCRH